MDLFNLKGKKAIVTGGVQGLGKGMVEGFCEAGVSVAIWDISDKVEVVAKEFCDKGYDVIGIKVNLGDRKDVEAKFEETLKKFDGKLDILLNNAGVQSRHFCEEFPLEDWDFVMNINLNAVFQLCQLAGRVMIKQGKGKIINLASMLSFFGGYTVPAYAASKGAVAQLTKALSNEWAAKGINVNAMAPGYMATDMNTKLLEDEGRNSEITARIPAHRWGTANDMKGPALFLASAASDYLNGAIIPVDGGYLVR